MDSLNGIAKPLRSRKKIYCTRWTFASLLSAPLWAFMPIGVAAGPAGGHIVGGSGSIFRPNNDLTEIHQRSDRLAIDWQQFDVNANEVVRFIQPSSRSIALNRILDSKQSLILGRIEANGKIFLVNPRGIIFGKDATVNVAGLVASSLDIDPRNFIKGNFAFTDNGGEGVIVNQGTIEAAVGGAVVLLGKVVINEGDIRAPRGSANLVSAGGAVISFDDNNQLGIQITAQQKEKIDNQADAVRNSGTISAEGGYIALTGATTADLFTNAVNNEGVLVANSVRNHNGVIELVGGEGNVEQSGEINVSAIDKVGGVDINSGGKINISGNAIHNTGKLIANGANGGSIQLHANDLIAAQNDATINAIGSNGKGGHIELLADRVGVLDNSRIDASGSAGGGVVHVGGAFHGENHGTGPRNAQRVALSENASIAADAIKNGNGGEVVLWSDDITYFAGNIFARGGSNGGDGGNVEVSGKNALSFFGHVDTSAAHGKMGNLLLDPAIINIINGSGGAQDAGVADGVILSGDSPSPYQISEQALEALTSNVTLTATQQINIANLADNELLFNPNGGTVTFNINGSGNTSFTMADVNDTIRVNNGNLVINSTNTGGNVNFTLGNLTTTTAGNITVTASASCTASFFSSCNGGTITFNSGAINAAGTVTVHGDSTGQSAFSFFSGNSGGDIAISLGNIASGGAVAIDAVSDGSTGAFFGTPSSGLTTITLGNIIENGHANIQVTASSPRDHTKENIFIGGNYLTDGTGGNISISSNALNLTSDTLLEDAVFAASGTMAVTFNTLVANGHQLVQGYNNIYVGDISGSATTFGDFGFSQANIDAFTGTGLMLRAKNNVFLGNTTATSASATSVQLVADRDNSGGGDLSIASGKTFDANGRNFIGSGANATINGSIVNSGTGSQQFNATSAINFGSGATLTSASGNIALTAGTAITMANNATITSTTGQLALTAANNIALGSLTTGNTTTSAVNVTSTAGAISNAGAATNISANAVGSRAALHAASGIAANLSINDLTLTNSGSGTVSLTNDRALQISSFTNTPATTSSVITTGVGSNMTIAGNVASGSNLTLTSSGTFSVTDGFTVNSNAGTLAINATGDAAITGLTSTNNTASAISVISGGAIADNGNTNLDITATQPNAVVTLQAANGIGAANALDLAIAKLALVNSTAGAVNVTNNRALQINSLTNTPATTTTVATTGAGSNMTIAGNVASGSDIALTSSGTFSVTDGFTINPSAGTLTINATGNAAITGLTTTNNTASAISVISGGAITDSGDTNLDITATQPNSVVTLQAANGIGAANPLDLSIANLALTNSTSGAVSLTNNRALQINSFTNTPATTSSVTTTGGGSNMTIAGNVSSGSNLTLTSSGTFSVIDGFTVNSNAGTLAINAAGDAAITGLTTTNNTASAISVISGGAITDNGNTNVDITATQANAVVTLQAANGIGAANALDLSIAKLALTNSTSGAVSLTNNRALQINSLTNTPVTTTTITTTGAGSNMTIAGTVASGSDIALTSSGTFSVTDGFTVNSNAGTLTIHSTGNAAITGLTTTNNTASAISVISGGAIADNGDTNADITATQPSAVVTLQAASGIGTGNAIDINVASITATNGSSGDIRLHALGSFTFNAVDNSASPTGAVALSSDGNLTVNNVTTASGAIILSAFDDVLLAPSAVLQSTAGNISISADSNSNGVGKIAMGSGSINSGSGTITLSAAQDINLNTLTTTNATTSAVSITSTAGKILGNFDGTADITAASAGARVTLHAATGIDAGSNPLELSILDLIATNSTSGGINVTNDRALQISGVTNTPATATTIATTGVGSNMTIAGNVATSGNLTLTSSGTFTVNNGNTVNSNAGTLSINATGDAAITGLISTNNTASAISVISGGAIIDNGNTNLDITATQPNAVVTLQAANGIGAGNALDLAIATLALTNSASGAVSVTNNRTLQINSLTNTPVTTTTVTTTGIGSNMIIAGNVASGSDIALTSSGTFSVTDGFTVNSNAGTLSINATGNAAITGLTTTNNTVGAISVVSGGAISDNGDTSADITAMQPNAVVTLQAANGIGNTNPLDIDVSNIAASNGSSGDIRLHALSSFTFSAIDNSASPSGAVALSSDGNLIVNNITTAAGAIILSAFDDVLFASNAVLQSISGNVAVTADSNSNNIGKIDMGSGSINSGSGTIALSAAQDINLNTLTTTNATTNAVAITSTTGKILGNFDGTADITAASASSRVTLNAANGIDAGSNPLELSIVDLAVTNSGGAVNVTNDRTLQISSFANTGNGAIAISATGSGSDIIFGGVLQNGGGNATLTATRHIDLQNIQNVAALHTNSATVNYAQNISAGSIGSTGTATVANNLTATTGNIDLQGVTLGAGNHVFTTSSSGDIVLGNVGGNGNLQLSSGRDIALNSVALGTGNFSASSNSSGVFTANGTISAGAITLNQFSTINLLRVVAGNALAITGNTINLGGDLLSNGAMTLTGTTQLQNDVALDSTAGGIGTGGALQLAGSVNGNSHSLTLAAGTNVVCIACTTGASASGLATLDIQSSIKTVMGATSVIGNATIRADQEIYLNDNTSIGGNLALLADANNDGIGIAALLTGKTLNVVGSTIAQPIALTSIDTAAQCTLPTALPHMPAPPSNFQPLNTELVEAVQESGKYGFAVSTAMLHNASQIAYLNSSCQSNSDTHNNRAHCDVDASMLDFLGTFLIDNQIPQR